jgi:hypothetical protein
MAMAFLALGLAASAGACESASVSTDACTGTCPGNSQCATVCPCDASDCPTFECVIFGFEGGYFRPDGGPVASCSTP